MVRTMLDGVDATQVPKGAAIYAGYNDGEWQSFESLADQYPSALHVSICVAATGDARVLDVETGDASPEEAPGWVTRQRAAGESYPVVYCNQANTWPAVKAAFVAQKVAPPLYWVAAYVNDPTKVPAIPAGAIALQYYDHGGYDASAVADYWPGLDEAPQAVQSVPQQTAPQEGDMTTYYTVQVLPDPTGAVNACGVCTWPAGKAGTPGVPHVLQLAANPSFWGDAAGGQFRLSFDMLSGGDVETTIVAKPSESVAIELASVPGYNPQTCRGVMITRPDGKKWPWGGGAE